MNARKRAESWKRETLEISLPREPLQDVRRCLCARPAVAGGWVPHGKATWVGPSWKSYLATQVDLSGGPFQDGLGCTPGGPFHDDGDTIQDRVFQYNTSARQVSTAGHYNRSVWQVSTAGQYNRSVRQISTTGQYGRSVSYLRQVSTAAQYRSVQEEI